MKEEWMNNPNNLLFLLSVVVFIILYLHAHITRNVVPCRLCDFNRKNKLV